MATASQPKQIDALMEKASQALAKTKYFKAEKSAMKALQLARQAGDFERLARIVMPLQEARRQRLQLALDVPGLTVITQTVHEETAFEAGCFLIQPPQVGADARRLRTMALEREIPVAVICREPLTQLGLVPVVAIAPGATIRTKVQPPADPDDIDRAWFLDAMEALGDFAIQTIDPTWTAIKRLDVLLLRLDAIPDHEGLHHALVDLCHEAEQEAALEQAEAKASGKR